MAGKIVTVLYFGDTHLSAVAASRGTGGAFIVHGKAAQEYGGIINGEFVNPENLPAVVKETVRTALCGLKTKVDKIYIGTPHIFCDCFSQHAVTKFAASRKVKNSDLQKLIHSVEYTESERTVVKKNAVYYRLDDGRAVINAVGETAKKVEARVSIISVANSFITEIRSCLLGTGIKNVEFLSCALAESLYFVDEETRDHTIVMISCGMFATAVSVCCGDGLMYLKSFEQGLAHIINDVSVVLSTGFGTATTLVNEAVLSVKMTEHDNYEIKENDKKEKYGAAIVNDIIKSRMEIMAEYIMNLVMQADKNILKTNAVFICGGNLDAIEGARDFFGKAIGAHIAQCVCPMTKQNRSGELSVNALLNMALLQEK